MRTAVDLQLDAVFANIKARFDELSRNGMVCEQGSYGYCSVLKLQKPSWTNDPMDRVVNTSGIFFSRSTNDRSIKKNRAKLQHPCLESERNEGLLDRESRFRL